MLVKLYPDNPNKRGVRLDVQIEEYGEDNGRYHIHGFLVFKYGYGFEDFRKWPSRQKLEEISEKIRLFGDMVVFSSYAMQVITAFLMLFKAFTVTHKVIFDFVRFFVQFSCLYFCI